MSQEIFSAHEYNQRGTECIQECNYGKAIENFSNAIKLKPEYFHYYLMRGKAHFFNDDQENARKDFEKVNELKKSSGGFPIESEFEILRYMKESRK